MLKSMLKKVELKILLFVLMVSVSPACVLFDEVEYDEENGDSDSQPLGNDYWETGYCPGNTAVDAAMVSDNCNGITLAGCCDANGNALYCYNNRLFCQSCQSNVAGQAAAACSWDSAQSCYWCTDADMGVDPSGAFLKACPAF
ncbi:MAG: hypothetical protein JXX29_02310 [Deltaproteobacteria bacterium]|nr:hypothetical protein [Deltaproteobacteria bacterium]MBN2670474.1 hypothetical protein [Deltaproteobacteria bacterium]